MGRKFTVPYAVYMAHGFVNPFLAEQTGFSDSDLQLLWDALVSAFQFDQSAARPAGSMTARKLVVFEHKSQLGNAPSHTLLEQVKVGRRDTSKPARDFSEFEVKVPKDGLPAGITVLSMV